MGKGAGYAKAILFGEHFVVYGLPAIGAALSKKIEVEAVKSPHMKIEASHADGNLIRGMDAIKGAMGVSENFLVKVNSEIQIGSGLGSSAAISVAFARAVSDELKIGITDEQASSYAYEAEKIYHATPSGIDNNLAARGGAIHFQKSEGGNRITPLKIGRPLWVAIGNTGKKRAPTSEIIASVKSLKERQPALFEDLSNAERKIVGLAVDAISDGRMEEIGELMNINHGLLSAIGVSSRENELIVQAARDAGALGAKITGAGRGGSCVALAKSEKHAEEISAEIRKLGYIALTSVIQ